MKSLKILSGNEVGMMDKLKTVFPLILIYGGYNKKTLSKCWMLQFLPIMLSVKCYKENFNRLCDKTYLQKYCIYPKYSDKQPCTSSTDHDQTSQNEASDQGLHKLPLIQHSKCSKFDLFKLQDKYGNEERDLNNLNDQG